MLKLEENEFLKFVDDLKFRGSDFCIETKRNVNSIVVDGNTIALSKNKSHFAKKEEKKDVISLFAQVSKSVNNFILSNNFNVEKIEQRHDSSFTNRDKYNRMKIGSEFCYVDISHCYWRIAFLKGYISIRLYESVLKKPELKIYRNMSLACIVAPKTRKYYYGGFFINEISEDKELWKTIYDNIRFTAYNLMGDLANDEKIKRYFIAYRTDGIMITKPAINTVVKKLSEYGFESKKYKCLKIDNKHYFFDGKRAKKI